jgi:hypothetical protein
MALVDIIGGDGDWAEQIPVHQFMALMFWHATDPTNMPASKARDILEAHLGRTLSGGEVAEIQTMKTLDPRQLERAFMLMETDWITRAEAKTLLGL